MDSSGTMTPSALIPFCAYQTDMLLVGHHAKGFTFPACKIFQPSVLEGQLCYSLNISALSTGKAKEGRNNGLLIILDLGAPKDYDNLSISGESNQSKNVIRLETLSPKTSHARIYLNTLSSFSEYRPGSYGMIALKKMTGTKSFLKLSDESKECQTNTLEDCQTKGYVKEVMKECGCVPWALSDALKIKDPIFCAPNASACYTAVSKNTYSCLVSCTGLYADVQFTTDRILAKDNKNSKEEDKEKLMSLLEEYKRYKTEYAQNIKFDPDLMDLGLISSIYSVLPLFFQVQQ